MTDRPTLPRAVLALLATVGFVLLAAGLPCTAALAAGTAEKMRIFTDDPTAPKVVPKSYDVTIVEYFDYACPYCKAMQPALDQLIASDHKVRIVYRDWPVIGAASPIAARAAIASQWQGKHAAFHDALLSLKVRLTEDTIRMAADEAGVDWDRLQRDQKAHAAEIDKLLAETDAQAEALGLTGTPGLLVGSHLLRGAVDLPTLRRIVAIVRDEQAKES